MTIYVYYVFDAALHRNEEGLGQQGGSEGKMKEKEMLLVSVAFLLGFEKLRILRGYSTIGPSTGLGLAIHSGNIYERVDEFLRFSELRLEDSAVNSLMALC